MNRLLELVELGEVIRARIDRVATEVFGQNLPEWIPQTDQHRIYQTLLRGLPGDESDDLVFAKQVLEQMLETTKLYAGAELTKLTGPFGHDDSMYLWNVDRVIQMGPDALPLLLGVGATKAVKKAVNSSKARQTARTKANNKEIRNQEIRALKGKQKKAVVAREFGISEDTVQRIWNK